MDRTDREQGALPWNASTFVGSVLTVLSGEKKGATTLVGTRLRIGKANDNDLVLPDKSVSRYHCEITRSPAGLRLRDLGSTNGTKLDGVHVVDAFLRPGATIKVGAVDIEIKNAAPSLDVLPSERTRFGFAVGKSLAMRRIFGVLEYIAPSDATVLLLGETGTGKDILARSIAAESRRKDKPFIALDCAALPRGLAESELFGHERGAFTGAAAMRKGAFEIADGGTLFIDEVGELPLDLQPKFLRALEAKEVKRVGGKNMHKIDVRLIAATMRDLDKEVAKGAFRNDLFFRLNVVPVYVPPLRERREDIPVLVETMLAALQRPMRIENDALAYLSSQDWPGNVRELRNTIERAAYLAIGRARDAIAMDDLGALRT